MPFIESNIDIKSRCGCSISRAAAGEEIRALSTSLARATSR
jgi:hypothetical protein